jgi:Fe-S-cluster-containing dehydrogenase component
MSDRVIAIDYEKCTGCRTCEISCSLATTGEADPEIARIRIVKIQEASHLSAIPIVCMNCVKPICKAVCPTRAIYESPITGARLIDEDKCIACSACVYACPFGAIAVDRSAGRAFTCNHCDGDPICVKFCPSGAIQYIDADEVGIRLRRSHINRFLESADYCVP